MVEKKFKALRFVSGLFQVLAWIVLVLGILSAIGVLIAGIIGGVSSGSALNDLMPSMLGGVLGGVLGFIAILIGTLIEFVVLKATSELFVIFVSIEHNTRMTAYYVSGGVAPVPADPDMVAPPPIR